MSSIVSLNVCKTQRERERWRQACERLMAVSVAINGNNIATIRGLFTLAVIHATHHTTVPTDACLSLRALFAPLLFLVWLVLDFPPVTIYASQSFGFRLTIR